MVEKGDEKEVKETKRRSGGKGIQVIILILVIALIWLMLVIVQVPYTTTNAVKEMVPVENCTQVDIPFAANFRTGLNYDHASKISSSDGKAIYRYSELNPYIYVNIINTGEEKGIYCLNAQAYVIDNFNNDKNSLVSFQTMIFLNSDRVKLIDNWSSNKYTYPVCTEKPISPIDNKMISLWTPSLLSKDVQNQYDLSNVYILLTVVPPMANQCSTVNVEKTNEQEVTRYCNAWKHVVGKC